MNTLVIQTATAAGLRVNVDGKMLNDNYTNVMGSFPSLVRFARAILARQPAAIDKEAAMRDRARRFLSEFVRQTGISMSDHVQEVMLNLFLRYAAPLDKEASKPAASDGIPDELKQRGLDDHLRRLAEQEQGMKSEEDVKPSGWKGSPDASPAAPSVEQDERVRQFEALCDLLPSDVSWGDPLTPDIALHIARAASTSSGRCFFCGEPMDGEHEQDCPQADASANVAQGAEAPCLACVSNWPLHDADCPDAAPPAQTALTDAARDVLAERQRQVTAEGWTPEHDDGHAAGDIAIAAACYAANAGGVPWSGETPSFWPWCNDWWKPTTPRRDLVKAGALILAEIERLDRRALTAAQPAIGNING